MAAIVLDGNGAAHRTFGSWVHVPGTSQDELERSLESLCLDEGVDHCCEAGACSRSR